jgi:acetyl-CoA C-acetyltransferase
MADRVAIVAAAQTKYHPDRVDVSSGELAYETVEKVLQETGLTFTDDGTGIDSTITCTQAAWEGAFIPNIVTAPYVGAHLRPEDKIAEDSINGVYCALAQILSGHFDIVLVVTHCMESQSDKSIIDNTTFDPIFQRLLGLDFDAAAAMQANRYMHKYGITAEQCAKVAVKNRGNARKNPFAQEPMDITVEDVLNSDMVAYPIRHLDTKPTSDGSCSMILACEEKAKRLTDKPVWIVGAGNCYEAHYLGDRDLAECDALVSAARRAYGMAGITNPLKEIDVAEISEEYSYQELLWMEGLGFCDRGEAGKLIDIGVTHLGGQLPVNPSGGLLSGNPVTVAGMARVAEAALQLRGEAGDRQVPGAGVALAHGVTGICGQYQCVMILTNK